MQPANRLLEGSSIGIGISLCFSLGGIDTDVIIGNTDRILHANGNGWWGLQRQEQKREPGAGAGSGAGAAEAATEHDT